MWLLVRQNVNQSWTRTIPSCRHHVTSPHVRRFHVHTQTPNEARVVLARLISGEAPLHYGLHKKRQYITLMR